MNLLSILLQTPAGGSQWSGILMMVVIVAIFYFFMIRPQQKKQKEIQKSREALKTGDKVITAGGIYGKIKLLFSLQRKTLSSRNNLTTEYVTT